VNEANQSRPSLRSIFAFGNVTLPNFINSIDDEGFEEFTSIKSLHMDNENLYIGYLAFAGCSQLCSIDIKGNVSFGGYSDDSPFENCYAINSITYTRLTSAISGDDIVIVKNNGVVVSNTDTTTITKHSGGFFTKLEYLTTNNLQCVACLAIGDITIPNEVTVVGDGAFRNCSYITSLNLNNTITISRTAFSGCSNLSGDLVLSNNVESIGWSSFSNCSQLNSLTISNNVTNVDTYAFYYCSNVRNLIFDNFNANPQ
jgi:hypothetical protein